MKPELDRLSLTQTFIRIVEAGSLSAAAAQMNTTQPTISRRLQALERSLGLALLVRSTHALRLTEAGASYYARARELAQAWSEFESDLRGSVEEAQGLLRVVAPHAFGQHHLVTPLTEFLESNPKVQVEWMLHDRPPNFVTEAVDCAIRVGEVSDPGVVAIRIGEVPRIVVGAPALLKDMPLPANPDALTKLPWLALAPYYRREIQLVSMSGEERLLTLAPRMVTDSLYALRSAALRGLGVAVSSAWVAQEALVAGQLIHLVPQWRAQSLPVYITYPYSTFYPAKLRKFVEAMRSAMRTQFS